MVEQDIEFLPATMPDDMPQLALALQVAVKQDDMTLLQKRAEMLPGMQIPIGFLKYVWGFGYPPFGFNTSSALIIHEPHFSTAEAIAVLKRERVSIAQQLDSDQMPDPIKTVTLGFKQQGTDSLVLLTGEGDFTVSSKIKKEVAVRLGLPKAAADRVVINPHTTDPVLFLRLIPGIVGPFIRNDLANSYLLKGVFYLQKPLEVVDSKEFVAVAVSPWETMIIKKGFFRVSLNWWHERNGGDKFYKILSIE